MILEKNAATSVPIHDLMTRRWSPRAYDANRPVSRAQLAALLEAARWAPSCNGVEPWRYLVWDRTRDEAGFQRGVGASDRGMPGEGQLVLRREDAQAVIGLGRGQQEGGFREVHPTGDALHVLGLELLGAKDDGDRVAVEGLPGEHIDLLEGQGGHFRIRSRL